MYIHPYYNATPSHTINPFYYSKCSLFQNESQLSRVSFLCFLGPHFFNSHSHFISPISGSLDCSSTHVCLEILGVGNTGAGLLMVTAFPTYTSTTAYDFVSAFAIEDLTVS